MLVRGLYRDAREQEHRRDTFPGSPAKSQSAMNRFSRSSRSNGSGSGSGDWKRKVASVRFDGLVPFGARIKKPGFRRKTFGNFAVK